MIFFPLRRYSQSFSKRLCKLAQNAKHWLTSTRVITCNPRLVYLSPHFEILFQEVVFQKILFLCIQERFVIKSGLWWRTYGRWKGLDSESIVCKVIPDFWWRHFFLKWAEKLITYLFNSSSFIDQNQIGICNLSTWSNGCYWTQKCHGQYSYDFYGSES